MAKSKKRSKKQYFGIVKLPSSTKFSWLSYESVNGYSLGLALNNRTVWVTGLRFKTDAEVSRALDSKVIFIRKNKK